MSDHPFEHVHGHRDRNCVTHEAAKGKIRAVTLPLLDFAGWSQGR